MSSLNNLIKIGVFGFLLMVGYQAKAEAPSCVTPEFYKIGDYDSPPGKRIFLFEKLRGALETALESGDADKATCLYDFYDKSAEAESGFWHGKAAAEGCDLENEASCSDPETPRSLKYLAAIHTKLENKLKPAVEATKADKQKTEAATGCTEGCGEGQSDEAALAAYLQNSQCCGTKEATVLEEMGTVRNKYPGLSYLQCLDKTDKTKKSAGTLSTMGSCALSAVTQVFKGMLDGVTAFFSLPGQLIAASAQIWSIITDPEKRSEFLNHLTDSVLEFIGVQSGELTNCLNDESKTSYYCENVGEVIGFLASPAIIGNIFKVAKLSVKAAASLFKTTMAASKTGAKILAKLNKAKEFTKRQTRVVKVVTKKKIIKPSKALILSVKTSKIAQTIIKRGNPFVRGAAKLTQAIFAPVTGTVNFLAPAGKVGAKVLALPSNLTDKAIIAGFNAGKKIAASNASTGKQVITSIVAKTATPSGEATAASANVVTTARGAPLETPAPISMSGQPTTIQITGKPAPIPKASAVEQTAPKLTAISGKLKAKTSGPSPVVQKPVVTINSQPSVPQPKVSLNEPVAEVPATNVGPGVVANTEFAAPQPVQPRPVETTPGLKAELVAAQKPPIQAKVDAPVTPLNPPSEQVLPRVNPTTANPTGNPYLGTPARNLNTNLTGTNLQLRKVEQQLADNPTDPRLLASQQGLQAKKQLLEEALAPKPPARQPTDGIKDGSTPLFQGARKEVATTSQVKAAEINIGKRAKRGGEAEVKTYVAVERERLNGLLSKYDDEIKAVSAEAKEVRPAKIKKIEEKKKAVRQQLDALEQAERNLQYRRWEASEDAS